MSISSPDVGPGNNPSLNELALMKFADIIDIAQTEGITPTESDILDRKKEINVYVGVVALSLVRAVGSVVNAEDLAERRAAIRDAATTIDENPIFARDAALFLYDLQRAKQAKLSDEDHSTA